MRFRQAVIEHANKHGVTETPIRCHLNRQLTQTV